MSSFYSRKVWESRKVPKTVFIDRGDGQIELFLDGIVNKEDIDVLADKHWEDSFTALEVSNGITKIGAGVIETFPKLTELELPKSLESIVMTEELAELLHHNDVLVRGHYGSYGDTFARENNLRFKPKDICLGVCHRPELDERTILTLRFCKNGKMEIIYDIHTTGISAGSDGGAVLHKPMPKGYRPGCTPAEFAALFPTEYHDQILNNEEVKAFLKHEAEKAGKKS